MARARIICIGNPYHRADWVGPAVFAALREMERGPGVEVVDGGLQGLNLLPLLEDVDRVVFADTLLADDAFEPDALGVLEDPFDGPPALGFDHAGGLAYLLQAAPVVLAAVPKVWVVGATARAPCDVIQPLARACLDLARTGKHGLC